LFPPSPIKHLSTQEVSRQRARKAEIFLGIGQRGGGKSASGRLPLRRSEYIATANQIEAAQSELRRLEDWLSRLQREHPAPSHRLSKAGIRKMIARPHEELAVYEGSQEVQSAK
jgi:hypothetical protein